MRAPGAAPEAEVVRYRAGTAVVACPLCGARHTHRGVQPGLREHRAADCDLYATVTGEQRAAGYTFTAPPATARRPTEPNPKETSVTDTTTDPRPDDDPVAAARAAAYRETKSELNAAQAADTYRVAAVSRGLDADKVAALVDALDPRRLLDEAGDVDFDKIACHLDAATGTTHTPIP